MKTRQMMSGRERAEMGCIVSFENGSGERLTLHMYGPPQQGLRDACEAARAKDETYLVVAYSTPQTILADLEGSRGDDLVHPRADSVGERHSKARLRPLAEQIVLGKAGLPEMLHPRLMRGRGESH